MSASFPTNCSTGSRMPFSWLPMESRSCCKFIPWITLLSLFCFTPTKHGNIKICLTFSSAEDKQKNPMVQLFYGTFVTERKHEGTSFIWAFVTVNFSVCSTRRPLTSPSLCSGKVLCNIEQFGQYPLQVNGFNNLDECLEGAMVEKEIELLHSEPNVTSGREVSKSKEICFICADQISCVCH